MRFDLAPFGRVRTKPNMLRERRMGPLGGVLGVTMPDGVEMDVIEMLFKIVFVADEMLPEPSLPYAALTFVCHRSRPWRCDATARNPTLSEIDLDPPPSPREIRIAARQRPKAVQMIR